MFSIYGLEETTATEKNSNILSGIKEKQLCCENSSTVSLLLLGEWPDHESLLRAFNNLHMCLNSNLILVYHLLGTHDKLYIG